MRPVEREETARSLLSRFADATGVGAGSEPRRYLWTDAFAVCTWAGLATQGPDGAAPGAGGGDELELARTLVDQVHDTLGRHRPDDERSGWISGLDEAAGEARPTAGGLRIGKPHAERSPDAPLDPELEWGRDGQYYHYLTKWMRALDRMASVTGEARYAVWAAELAIVAFEAFSHGPGGVPESLYWKMSIDLSRPLVPSMGQHDALDGYVVITELLGVVPEQPAAAAGPPVRPGPPAGPAGPTAAAVRGAAAALATVAERGAWATGDPLGAGSLLSEACILARLDGGDETVRTRILARVLDAAARSLDAVRRTRILEGPASRRLAFRELGLSLGLAGIERLTRRRAGGWRTAAQGPEHREVVRRLAGWTPIRAAIESFWADPENQAATSWGDHEDINTVMLAASLAPDGYLGTFQYTSRGGP